MEQFKEITITQTIREFTRTKNGSRSLSNADLVRLDPGDKITVGHVVTMVYDHKDQHCVQIIDTIPERFIILRELGQNPWNLDSPKE